MDIRVLKYNNLDTTGFENKIKAIIKFLSKGNFRNADVKKLKNTNYYRAKLDKTNRLLFSFAEHENEKIILLLELIRFHRYERSRFLNDQSINPEQITEEEIETFEKVKADDVGRIKYIDSISNSFHLLNRPIVFDNEQRDLYDIPLPAIIVGSAGSGKTAITLEKMKVFEGDILYVTLSSFLAENSRSIYYSYSYKNENQSIDFLSYKEFLDTFAIPAEREVTFQDFSKWFQRLPKQSKEIDSHKLFEEFKGVLTGFRIENPYLKREEYVALGIKQSIFLEKDRSAVYDLFEKYLIFLRKEKLYDINILSHLYLDLIEAKYDYVFIDEVQDLTNIQIYLILKSLKNESRGNFALCGDSNQIVHPNFFSWSHLKTLFFNENIAQKGIFNVLQKNYRSSEVVTNVANQILKIKNERFGSIDKESNYLVTSNSSIKGEINILNDRDRVINSINKNTALSAKFAVIVLNEKDKDDAKNKFKTPLLFSIREVKGLEYENIVLYNFVSNERKTYSDIIQDITHDDLRKDNLDYRRNKNKSDKSLEIYKFFINALYVGISRSTKNIYFIEKDARHRIFDLLSLKENSSNFNLKEQSSSKEEWQKEAQLLEKQGKLEQANAIRANILKTKPVPWIPLDYRKLGKVIQSSYDINGSNKQDKRMGLAYGVLFHDKNVFQGLARAGYKVSENAKSRKEFAIKRFCSELNQPAQLNKFINDYGIDYPNIFGLTPLMMAVIMGKIDLVEKLLHIGASQDIVDFTGRTAFDIATCEAIADQDYAQKNYKSLFKLLAPGSIKIKVDNRLIKIDQRLMEYTLLTCLRVAIHHFSMNSSCYTSAFNALDALEVIEHFPESIIPEKRKKRPYVSSILSKNERDKESLYNRKIFLRERRGFYNFNPDLHIALKDNWIKIYSNEEIERFKLTALDEYQIYKMSSLAELIS